MNRGLHRFVCAAAVWGVVMGAHAATSLSAIRYTPDITVSLGALTAGPKSVVHDAMGAPSSALTGLPADVRAYRYT